MAKKLAEVLVALVFGGVRFEPRTFTVTASKNAAAQTVEISFRVPVEQAQALVDAAKKGGAVAGYPTENDFTTSVTYTVEPKSGGSFTF
jgi:hypothetical protein